MDHKQGRINAGLEADVQANGSVSQANQTNDQPAANDQNANDQHAANDRLTTNDQSTGVQHNFVNQLINKDDQVTGAPHQMNRLLILMLKCFYLRKQKKISTAIEILLPVALFLFAFQMQLQKGQVIEKPNSESINDQSNLYSISDLDESFTYNFSEVYYDWGREVDAQKLDTFLADAFRDFDIELRKLSQSDLIKSEDYYLVNFTEFDDLVKRVNYSIKAVNSVYNYNEWFRSNYGHDAPDSIPRMKADRFHEAILRALSTRPNLKTDQYKVNFKPIDVEAPKSDDDKSDPKMPKFKGPQVYRSPKVFSYFTNALFFAFFLSGIFVLTSVCGEKQTRSFEFLKLMGATDGEILFGHFLNFFLAWLFALVICLIILCRVVSDLPFNVLLIFIIFSVLFFVQYICFLFLISAPFEKYLYAELVLMLLSFLGGYSMAFAPVTKSFVDVLWLAHPLVMLRRLTTICESTLSYQFNFRENIFAIFTFSTDDEISLLTLEFIVVCHVAIFIVLTNYIIQVNPFQKGIAKPFYYFAMPAYWTKRAPITEYVQPDQKEFERVSANRKPAIILKDVSKSFNSWLMFGRTAVLQDFNFAIYENQITVLLGHNGAGKTTTMDMIAGLSHVDAGSITVQGIPVSPYTGNFKKCLGYCPQVNIFYETLTVYENLKVAAVLKGVSFASMNRKIVSLADQFDLKVKLSEQAKNLSGGIKRRLCLAMAIIGYNEVMVVDEPSSGLDPENRRKVWEIMLELRKYKTILMTTHFMEEADILGDTIAIMHSGKVRCSGSTMFLKKLYHVGYLLRLVTGARGADEQRLISLIREHVPDAYYENTQANEHFIRLALGDQRAEDANLNLMIASLFDAFEERETKEQFDIEAYGLTNTSLEDVFIKIGELDQHAKEVAIDIETAKDHPLHNLDRAAGFSLYLQQFVAIFVKKFWITSKNLQWYISSIYPLLLPTISVLLYALIIGKLVPELTAFNSAIESFDLKTNLGNTKVLLMNSSFDPKTDLFRAANHGWLQKTFGFEFVSCNSTKATEALRKEREQLGYARFHREVLMLPERVTETEYQIFVSYPMYPFSLVGGLESFYRSVAREAGVDFNVSLSFEFTPLFSENQSPSRKILDRIAPYFFNKVMVEMVTTLTVSVMLSFPFVAFVELLNEEMNSGALDMQIMAGLSRTLYWVGNFVFDYVSIFVVFGLGCIGIFLFDDFRVLSPHLGAVFAVLALAAMNCLFVTYFVVNLQMNKSITGIIIKYSLLITSLVFAAFDMLFFFFVTISRMDKMDNVALSDLPKENVPLHFLFIVLSPVYNTLTVIFEYSLRHGIGYCYEKIELNECHYLNWRDFNLAINIVAYLTSMALFGSLIVAVNYFKKPVANALKWAKSKWPRFRSEEHVIEPPQVIPTRREVKVDFLQHIEDPNIEAEKQLAQLIVETNSMQDNILVVYDLSKKYGDFTAVNHLSFTVKREECFGLLGINGAGKTTTFKMIGGSQVKSGGQIILDGYKYESDPYAYYRRLGYCPQENTHTKGITAEDNLRFYASINGIPRQLVERAVRTLIEECDLQDHGYKSAEKLSGGNKRKLSTAIALIGKKDLILLDEPTTGVDPVARRKLWKAIDFYKKELKTSFTLTSHSMEEVEQLCSKISIMVAGQFKCLGTFSYLKERYSKGFTITIKVKDKNNTEEHVATLKNRITSDFNGKASLKEFYMNTMVYILMSKAFNWSHLFRAMEHIKTEMELIEDFLISDTNLEKIFLSFAEK